MFILTSLKLTIDSSKSKVRQVHYTDTALLKEMVWHTDNNMVDKMYMTYRAGKISKYSHAHRRDGQYKEYKLQFFLLILLEDPLLTTFGQLNFFPALNMDFYTSFLEKQLTKKMLCFILRDIVYSSSHKSLLFHRERHMAGQHYKYHYKYIKLVLKLQVKTLVNTANFILSAMFFICIFLTCSPVSQVPR